MDASRQFPKQIGQWQVESDRIFGELTQDELHSYLKTASSRSLVSGHAYSSKEISQVLALIDRAGVEPDDPSVLRQFDMFAAYVGLRSRTIPANTPAKRRRQIDQYLIPTIDALLNFLFQPETLKEFLQPDGELEIEDYENLVAILPRLRSNLKQHTTELAASSRPGKSSRSDFMSFYLAMVDAFVEFFNPRMRPSRLSCDRHGWHYATALHLAAPILPSPSRGLQAAVRNFVGSWNIELRKLQQQAKSVEK